ncbi:MAG: ABC transporter substrate-binding protein [Candidatus Heimdallarchaeota archaeon]
MIAFTHQRKTIRIIIISSIVLFSLINVPVAEAKQEPFFSLIASAVENSYNMPRFFLLQEQLKEIGINLEFGHFCWIGCIQGGYFQSYFDIGFVNLYYEDFSNALYVASQKDKIRGYPDFYSMYGENGSGNYAGYKTSMDFDKDLQTGKNEWYLNEYQKMFPFNSIERIQHYWDWQNYLMDKILPCYPTAAIKSNTYYWDELLGYNETKGMVQSWNDIYWSEPHEGQQNINELVMIDYFAENLNPINQSVHDRASAFVNDLILEPLAWFDSDKTMYPHLANNFVFLNQTHLRLQLRENIKWQNDSDNLFNDEYFDAEDVYFTYFVKKYLSEKKNTYQWIKDMKIINQKTLDIFIDDNPDTIANDPNPDVVNYLDDLILPEHYLNQTQLADGITPDYNHLSWEKFNEHCFGTGRFQIESVQQGYQTAFNIFDEGWHLNETITSDPLLDWTNRFGSQPATLEKLIINTYNYEVEEITAFQNGEADLITKPTWKDFSSSLIESEEFNYQTDTYYSLNMFIFNLRESRGTMINSMEPCPNDPNTTKGLAVRKAIAYAINADEMNEMTYSETNLRTYYPIYEKMGMWCNPDIIKYDYNLEKAKDYMRMAGYTYPEDTTLVGIDFPISLLIILSEIAVIIGLRKYRRKKWTN